MNFVIFFFGSGAAFLVGVAGGLIAGLLFQFSQRLGVRRLATLAAILGMILVGLSATPLPYSFYAVAGIASLGWLFAERSSRSAIQIRRGWMRAATMGIWLIAVGVETPHHFAPALPPLGRPVLSLFADSVTAGMGEAKLATWPNLLAVEHGIEVRDHSQAGATVRSMLRQAEKTTLVDGVVLLEIGGNDLLGSTTAADFERDLDLLLTHLSGPGRVILMFELPLPPLANAFGMAQRRLAAKHGARLVPKRIFVGVLTADGATVDGVHLTRAGHARMAAVVGRLIEGAYDEVK